MQNTNPQIAILPEEIKNFGIGARVYTTTTTQLIEQTPTLYLNQLYKHRGKSKKQMDAIIKNILQISKNTLRHRRPPRLLWIQIPHLHLRQRNQRLRQRRLRRPHQRHHHSPHHRRNHRHPKHL